MLTFEDLARNSKTFKKNCCKFPISTNRIKNIARRNPELQTQIADHANNTSIIAHHEITQLISDFLEIKRRSGSSIEKQVYASINWSNDNFIARLFEKRAIAFLCGNDFTRIVKRTEDGTVQGNILLGPAKEKWELVGTDNDPDSTSPLSLPSSLSYDEMQISALLGLSSPALFINSGSRDNAGKPMTKGTFVESGIYIGLVGARFENMRKMEAEYCAVIKGLSTEENGYGKQAVLDALSFQQNASEEDWKKIEPGKRTKIQNALRMNMWAKFYGFENHGIFYLPTFEEAESRYNQETTEANPTFLKVATKSDVFLNIQIYTARIRITAETLLLEAARRGHEVGKLVYVHVVGLGLGVWTIDQSQHNIFVGAFAEAITFLLQNNKIPNVDVVNFSFVRASECGGASTGQRIIVSSNNKTVKGPRIIFSKRNVADRLEEEYKDHLLVGSYAWDSNAFPGNEYWEGSLTGSGDPAAACCSTISELQNPLVNPFWKRRAEILE